MWLKGQVTPTFSLPVTTQVCLSLVNVAPSWGEIEYAEDKMKQDNTLLLDKVARGSAL